MPEKHQLSWYDDECNVDDKDENEDEEEFNSFEDLLNGCWNLF